MPNSPQTDCFWCGDVLLDIGAALLCPSCAAKWNKHEYRTVSVPTIGTLRGGLHDHNSKKEIQSHV